MDEVASIEDRAPAGARLPVLRGGTEAAEENESTDEE